MPSITGKEKEDLFKESLTGKEIPVLTLDNKWYKLLDKVGRENLKPYEDQLNELLKKQGKINTEIKDIKKIKKRLMEEIVAFADESSDINRADAEKKIAENKRLVEECNQKLDNYQEDLIDLPREINELNKQLMLLTMEHCYETIQENTDSIEELDLWLTQIRIELKKKLITKQEMEARNHEIYSYMHDIFGANVVDMFDLRYNPEDHHPKVKKDENSPNSVQNQEKSEKSTNEGPTNVGTK